MSDIHDIFICSEKDTDDSLSFFPVDDMDPYARYENEKGEEIYLDEAVKARFGDNIEVMQIIRMSFVESLFPRILRNSYLNRVYALVNAYNGDEGPNDEPFIEDDPNEHDEEE